MAVDQIPDPLARATEAVRAESDEGWIEMSRTVMDRVRTLVTPASAIVTHDASGSVERGGRGSTIRVSGRVLTPRLRAAIDSGSRAADSIDVEVVDDRCTAIDVSLVCTYGLDLQAEGRDVRDAVASVVHELLGHDPDFDPARDITIHVVDIVEGDPRTQ